MNGRGAKNKHPHGATHDACGRALHRNPLTPHSSIGGGGTVITLTSFASNK